MNSFLRIKYFALSVIGVITLMADLCGQADKVQLMMDSLQTSSPKVKAELQLRLAKFYRGTHNDSVLFYLNEAIETSRNQNQFKWQARAECLRMHLLINVGQIDSAENIYNRMIPFCKMHNLNEEMGMLHLRYGVIFEKDGLRNESIDLMRKALRLFRSEGLEHRVSACHTNMAAQFVHLRQLDSAIYHLEETIEYKERVGHTNDLVPDLGNMALMLLKAGDHQSAQKYLTKAGEYLDTNDFRLSIWMKTNWGRFREAQGDLELANAEGVSAWNAVQENPSLPYHTCDVALFYSGTLLKLDSMFKASEIIDKGIEVSHEHENRQIRPLLLLRRSQVSLALGEKEAALVYLKQADSTAKAVQNMDAQWAVKEAWPKYYEGIGDQAMALQAYRQLAAWEDSLKLAQKDRTILGLERRYRTAKLSEDLALKHLEIQEKESQQRKLIYFFSFTILGFLSFLWWYRMKREWAERQKELELQVKQQRIADLEELDTMKGNFFTNISHELRTPLSLILAPINDAITQSSDVGDQNDIHIPRRQAAMVQRNAKRLTTLVDQILDLSKLDSGQMTAYVQEGNILQFIKILFYSFESLCQSRGLGMAEDFPEEEIFGFFDPDKIEKIISNVLSNAVKHTPEGGTIGISVGKENDQIVVQIEDQGRGMTKEQVEQIFDRYYQAGNLDGTGVGLTLVHELVELIGGQIKVVSELNKGTSFKIYLPITREVLEQNNSVVFIDQAEIARKRESLSWMLPKEEDFLLQSTGEDGQEVESILVVEDNLELLNYISSILSNEYHIIQARNGQEGYDLAIEHSPFLIISDVMMPVMDGVEMCRRLKGNLKTSHIPVILLTAKVGQEAKLEGLSRGADEYITKPFQSEEMRIRVRNILDQRNALKRKFNIEKHMDPGAVELESLEEKFLRTVREEVLARLSDEHFSVEDLAQLVGFSRSQLHRKMKALTDTSPNEYIRHLRLTRAKDMLESRAASVSEVAYGVGFSNLSYFTKMYKKKFGEKPSDTLTNDSEE